MIAYFNVWFAFSADDNDVMFTEEIIRPVLSAMKVSYSVITELNCSCLTSLYTSTKVSR